jgi:hypothetical protein
MNEFYMFCAGMDLIFAINFMSEGKKWLSLFTAVIMLVCLAGGLGWWG